MSGLITPSGIHTNLRLRPDQVNWDIDGDTAQWLKTLPEAVEGGEDLFVVIQEDQDKPFIIMQNERDGSASILWRTDHLGEDTYLALRRMRFIPLSKRLDEIERQEERDAALAKEEEQADLYERIGGPMYHMLHRYGFAHGGKHVSTPLRNPTARRHRA